MTKMLELSFECKIAHLLRMHSHNPDGIINSGVGVVVIQDLFLSEKYSKKSELLCLLLVHY